MTLPLDLSAGFHPAPDQNGFLDYLKGRTMEETLKPKAAVHGQPQKAFSKNASDENERWRWEQEKYAKKNADIEKNNHYDYSRKGLNFEIVKGKENPKIIPLGSQEKRLHERLQEKLNELDFKSYKDGAQNMPNACVDWVFSGDHDRMCEMAFGTSYRNIDYTAERDNSEAIKKTDAYKYQHRGGMDMSMPSIYQWALDSYKFACEKWGEDNIIGAEVHLDETTPHMHLLMVPVAERKTRGRASTKYQKKSDPSVIIKKKEYETLSDAEKANYAPVAKASKKLVSYSGVFGDNYGERKQYMKDFHTEYHEKVGQKYGLERGDDLDLLDPEERRKRRHMRKDQLHAVQEYDKKLEDVKAEFDETQIDLWEAEDSLENIKNRIKSLPTEEELNLREKRDKELPSKEELNEREERSKNLPTFKQIEERENRDKNVPTMFDIVRREKIHRSNKQQLIRILEDVRQNLEDNHDLKTLGELNKLGTFKDDVTWFNAAYMFLSKRNEKLLKEGNEKKEIIRDCQKQIILLDEDINTLKEQETVLNKRRQNLYRASVLPVVDGGIEISIERSLKGHICVYAKINGRWIGGRAIDGDVLNDYNKGIASKENIAAIYLTGDILEAVKNDKEKEIENISKEFNDKKKEMYGKLILPNVGEKVDVSVRSIGGKNAIFASVGGVQLDQWHYLTSEQEKDLNENRATKEEMAALILPDYILEYVKNKKNTELKSVNDKIKLKKEELANIHVPTQYEIDTAEARLSQIKESVKTHENKERELKQTISDKQDSIRNLKEEESSLKSDIEKYKEERKDLVTEIEDLKRQKADSARLAVMSVGQKVSKFLGYNKEANELKSLQENLPKQLADAMENGRKEGIKQGKEETMDKILTTAGVYFVDGKGMKISNKDVSPDTLGRSYKKFRDSANQRIADEEKENKARQQMDKAIDAFMSIPIVRNSINAIRDFVIRLSRVSFDSDESETISTALGKDSSKEDRLYMASNLLICAKFRSGHISDSRYDSRWREAKEGLEQIAETGRDMREQQQERRRGLHI
jgi:hypothetical protein